MGSVGGGLPLASGATQVALWAEPGLIRYDFLPQRRGGVVHHASFYYDYGPRAGGQKQCLPQLVGGYEMMRLALK